MGFVGEEDAIPDKWIPFRPIPVRFTLTQHLIRLFYNPDWNELLYINTCAERLFEGGDKFYIQEIANRLLHAIQCGEVVHTCDAKFMYFRIRATYSEDTVADQMGQITDEVFLQSHAYALNVAKVIS